MSASGSGWEHFEHGADVGVRGWGPTREQAFEQAALALANVITDTATIEPRERTLITCEAPDDALLLVDWLDALVFETATRGMLFGRFAVRIEAHALCGEALEVAEREDGSWLAQCIVDV